MTYATFGSGIGGITRSEARSRRIRDAASAVMSAFNWREAPEGSAFWASFYDRLTDMADLAMPAPVLTVTLNGSTMTVAEARDKLASFEKEAA